MKRILEKMENNKILYCLVYSIMTAIIGLIVWPLLDLIVCKFITNSSFIYSVHQHIIQPVVFGIIMGIMFTFTNKKNK